MKNFYNILLVDDSKTTMYYNKKIIEYCNVSNVTHEVYNGLQALDFLKKKDFLIDVILLDLNMPVMDGFEFLNEFIELPDALKSNIKIAVLTTSNWNIDRERISINNNIITEYIEKPLQKEVLTKLLSSPQTIT